MKNALVEIKYAPGRFDMNKKKVVTILGLLLFPVFCALSVVTLGWFFVGNDLEDVSTEQEWKRVEVYFDNDGTQIQFQTQRAKLLSLDYNLKLVVIENSEVSEFPLGAVNNGEINEGVYISTYNNNQYLDTRDLVLDLSTLKSVEDPLIKYQILTFGEREWIGNVRLSDSRLVLEESEKFTQHFINESSKFASEWNQIDESSRFRVVKASEETLIKYLHIESQDDYEFFIFVAPETEAKISLIEYNGRKFLISEFLAINVENLLLIPTGDENLFLKEVVESGVVLNSYTL